jgi:hypothetical protein
MAKGAPKPNKGVPVGYGDKGKAFYTKKAYNQSDSGQRHAKNPNLSTKPVGKGADGNVFFNKAKYAASNAGRLAQGTGGAHPAGATTPMPGHPSQNPTHLHGPSTIGKISGPAPRGAK